MDTLYFDASAQSLVNAEELRKLSNNNLPAAVVQLLPSDESNETSKIGYIN